MTEPNGELSGGHGPVRNTLFSFAAQVIGAVFTIILTVFLVRVLGPADYGVLALAISVGTFVLLVSDLGISTSAARFTAERPTDRLHASAVLWTALRLKLLATATTAAAMVALAPTIAAAYDTPELTLPLRLIAISVAAQGFGALFLSWFAALRRVSLSIIYNLVESSVETTASICLVLLSGGAAAAVAGRAIGFTTAGILAAALAIRVVGLPALKGSRGAGFSARRIAAYGGALLIIDSAFALFDRVDVLIIGAILDASSAGVFEAAVRILTFLMYPGFAVGAGFAPRLAGERSVAEAARFLGALRYTILLYLLIAAGVLVWSEPIVLLVLGDGYTGSAEVLRALTPTVVLFGVSPLLSFGANYMGEARRRVPLAIAALLVNVVIDIILVPEIGITAGAIGTGVAFSIYTAGHAVICRRALGVSFASFGPTITRGLLAWAAAVLVLLAFGTSDLGILDWLLGPPLAGAAFVGALLLLREVRLEELRSAARLGRQALRRLGRAEGAA